MKPISVTSWLTQESNVSLSSLSSLIGSLATIYKNIQENEDVNKNKSVSVQCEFAFHNR